MSRYYEVEVVGVEQLAPQTWSVAVRRVDSEPFAIRAGQFLMMHFVHDDQKLNRSYSVANHIPLDEPVEELELCIALVDGGVGSSVVASWGPGSRFTASGPHGRFILRPGEEQDLVLVGTGTGVAPYRSMIPGLEHALAQGRRVDLVFGVRLEDQFLYDGEWKSLAARHTNFTYWRCASRAENAGEWEREGGIPGRVQSALDRIEWEPANTLFYLCGNDAMVEEVTKRLVESGVTRREIRTEAYTSPPPR